MSNKILFSLIGFAVLVGVLAVVFNYLTPRAIAPIVEPTLEENILENNPTQVGQTETDATTFTNSENIIITSPMANSVITNPLILTGEARGSWFFEATAPVSLVDWDGLIIANGFVTAQGNWMTEDFVPFTGELNFTSPYPVGGQDFMKNGTLIFQNDNPSGLPEYSLFYEMPVRYAL